MTKLDSSSKVEQIQYAEFPTFGTISKVIKLTSYKVVTPIANNRKKNRQIRMRCSPGARMFTMVVMKFIAPILEWDSIILAWSSSTSELVHAEWDHMWSKRPSGSVVRARSVILVFKKKTRSSGGQKLTLGPRSWILGIR